METVVAWLLGCGWIIIGVVYGTWHRHRHPEEKVKNYFGPNGWGPY